MRSSAFFLPSCPFSFKLEGMPGSIFLQEEPLAWGDAGGGREALCAGSGTGSWALASSLGPWWSAPSASTCSRSLRTRQEPSTWPGPRGCRPGSGGWKQMTARSQIICTFWVPWVYKVQSGMELVLFPFVVLLGIRQWKSPDVGEGYGKLICGTSSVETIVTYVSFLGYVNT